MPGLVEPSVLMIALALALLTGCKGGDKPLAGGWGGYTNDAPYEAPGNHGGYTLG